MMKMKHAFIYKSKVRSAKRLFMYRFFSKVPNLPQHVHFELTNHCNLKCEMCDRSSVTREFGFMDVELCKKGIDNVASLGIPSVQLNRFGEPMMHPSLVDIIGYAKGKGIETVSITSNGLLLNKKLSSEIIKSGLDMLLISIEGNTKQTYENIRKGGNFEKLTNNIENFLEMRYKLGSTTPRLGLNTILMDETEDEMEEFIERWKPLVDSINIKRALNYGNVRKFSEKTEKPHPCLHLSYMLVVLWNGDVTVCCLDFDGKLKVGNIKDSTIEEIWHSKEIERIRKIHLARQFDKIEFCSNCDVIYHTKSRKIKMQMSFGQNWNQS